MTITNASGSPITQSGHYRLAGVVRSEWTKLRTIRSTRWALVACVALALAVTALACATVGSSWRTDPAVSHADFDPINQSLAGLLIGQLAIGTLGVVVICAEYATGSIRTTLSAVPSRPKLLAAKAIALGAVVTATGLVTSLLSFSLGQALLSAPAPHATFTSPGALRAVIGGGLYLAVLGLLALGLGTIIRHTAGAISTFVALSLLLPWIVAQYLPNSVSNTVSRWLPANIGVAITSGRPHAHEFSPMIGFGVLCAYALLILAAGTWLMNKRDA